MSTAIYDNVLGIVNEVLRRLGVNTVTSLDGTKLSRVLLQLLNEIIDDISDYGDWQEMYREASVTAVSSVGEYEVTVSGQVKNIYEIHWKDDVAPLEVRDIQDMRRLQRVAGNGVPRQFGVVGVNASSGNPLFRVFPVPGTTAIGSAATFDIAYYQRPDLYTVSSTAATVPFPKNLVVQGLYAKALLFENGGEVTAEYQMAYTEYVRMRRENLNRFNADTGVNLYVVPTGHRYS